MGLCVTMECWGENYTLAVYITVEWCDVLVTRKSRVCMVLWYICRQRWCWPRVEGGFKGVSYSVRAWQDVAKIQKNFKGWPLEIPTNLGKFSNGKSLWYFSHVAIFAAKKERTADIYWFLEVAHHHSNMYTLESEERSEDGERGVSPEVDFCLCHLVFLSMSPDKHKRHGRARGVFGWW